MIPQATHKGNFIQDFGIDVECYVLDDDAKTAVISQRGMGAALRLGEGGASLPRFVSGKIISEALGGELVEKLSNPLIFNVSPPVGNVATTIQAKGHDVALLIDICKAIVIAYTENKLLKSQENIARQAQLIINASAKTGIKWLVYALAGYSSTREELISAFKFYIREEAREYEKEFPSQLYNEWYRLYGLQKPEKNHPWKFKLLTVNQVYYPLAKSSGKILELIQYKRDTGIERNKKLHQFLSEIGVKALRTHLGQLLGIAQVASSQEEYERYFRKIFGDQHDFDF